ncbi:MAG: NADH-quinone oxidoreductase subunit N [Desulfobulbus sp.]|jgi:NADH-quinone oxidoreductase subunit N
MMDIVAVNWTAVSPVLPELLLVGIAVLVVGIDLYLPRQRVLMPWLTVLGCITVMAMVLGSRPTVALGGMFLIDGYAMVFKTICLGAVIITALMSEHFCRIIGLRQGEYYSLLLLSTVGMLIMASAGDLIVLYLGLELMALPVYCLVGLYKRSPVTSEASVKYFLMGGFSSALLLFGVSLLYGLTGTTDLNQVAGMIASGQLLHNPAMLAALGLMLAGLSFKVAAVPFHMWTPDVYHGAPTILTAFMSVGPKAAGFAIFGRVVYLALPLMQENWGPILAILAFLTMGLGNITALCQTSLKRMLSYSSIAHAGYALLGLLAGTAEGMAATMSYMVIYLFMNMGAFGILMLMMKTASGEPCDDLSDCKGLAARNPAAAGLMLVFFFSLTGIPPTGGFVGKFYLFKSAMVAGYTPLVVCAVLFSAMSAFFYLRIIRYMYMDEPETQIAAPFSPAMATALVFCLIGVLGTGLFPGGLLSWTFAALTP